MVRRIAAPAHALRPWQGSFGFDLKCSRRSPGIICEWHHNSGNITSGFAAMPLKIGRRRRRARGPRRRVASPTPPRSARPGRRTIVPENDGKAKPSGQGVKLLLEWQEPILLAKNKRKFPLLNDRLTVVRAHTILFSGRRPWRGGFAEGNIAPVEQAQRGRRKQRT